MFTQDQINEWIAIGSSGDNSSEDNIFAKRPEIISLKRDLVDMKVLIDRWDLLSTDFIFHSLMEPLMKQYIKKDLEPTQDPNLDIIWGTNIHYIDTIPISKALVLDLVTKPFSSRHVAVFEVNLQHLQRVTNLKAFW